MWNAFQDSWSTIFLALVWGCNYLEASWSFQIFLIFAKWSRVMLVPGLVLLYHGNKHLQCDHHNSLSVKDFPLWLVGTGTLAQLFCETLCLTVTLVGIPSSAAVFLLNHSTILLCSSLQHLFCRVRQQASQLSPIEFFVSGEFPFPKWGLKTLLR